ncbi:MAG TPA: Wzz/FepE/Etk N-terminal domain-containing protein, partial [Phenylobacterium sp.]
MDLGHFLRVLWARKLVVLIALVSCMAGGIVMIVTTPKRYEAHTQVQLDLIKPDPVSGFHVNSKNSDAYVAAQIQDIRDFQVASKAAEAIGWLDNPDL